MRACGRAVDNCRRKRSSQSASWQPTARNQSPVREGMKCGARPVVTPPDAAWRRLRDMQSVLADQPLIAHAVHCLSLYDVLELQLELLRQPDWPDFEHLEPLPPNVIRFRPRRIQLT
jgi:hypothetical protein